MKRTLSPVSRGIACTVPRSVSTSQTPSRSVGVQLQRLQRGGERLARARVGFLLLHLAGGGAAQRAGALGHRVVAEQAGGGLERQQHGGAVEGVERAA